MTEETGAGAEPGIRHIVILTGAGASVPLGLPDTRGLIEHLTELRGELEAFLGRVVASHEGGKPDIEWILERLELYEDLETLLQRDVNLGGEALRAVKDVLKRCRDAADRVRSAFPTREWVPYLLSASFPATIGSGPSLLSVDPGILAGPLRETPAYVVVPPRDLGVTYEQGSLAQSHPLSGGHWQDVKPPSYEPGVDPAETARSIFVGLGELARRLRDTIYANIVRIYNSVDKERVAALYRPLVEPLWGISQSSSVRLRVFTTNWDPSFIALSDLTKLPIVTGIASKSYDPHWNPSVYDRGGLDVHHLHGCCRWVRKKAHPARILYNPLPLGKDSEYEVPVLYRPRSKGAVIADEPYATAYAALDRAAMEPAVWLVIGYSFRDEPIQRILERAAVRGTVKKLVVLDPAKTLRIPQELSEVTRHVRMEFGSPQAVTAALKELLSPPGQAAVSETQEQTAKARAPRRVERGGTTPGTRKKRKT